MIRRGLARCLKFTPVRRELQRLVVFRKRVPRLTLFEQHIAPDFQGVRPVRSFLVSELKLGDRPGEIGPFELTSYKQAKKWAGDIATTTAARHANRNRMESSGCPG